MGAPERELLEPQLIALWQRKPRLKQHEIARRLKVPTPRLVNWVRRLQLLGIIQPRFRGVPVVAAHAVGLGVDGVDRVDGVGLTNGAIHAEPATMEYCDDLWKLYEDAALTREDENEIELLDLCDALVRRYKAIHGDTAPSDDLLAMVASYF